MTQDEITLLKRIVEGKGPMKTNGEGVRLAYLINHGLVYSERVYKPTDAGVKALRDLERRR